MEKKCQFRISFVKNYALVEMEGQLTGDCFLAASKSVLVADDYQPGMHEIWKLSTVDLSQIDADTIEKVSREMDSMWKGINAGKVAVISNNSLNLGHIHLFRELYQQVEIRVFESVADAEKWICAD